MNSTTSEHAYRGIRHMLVHGDLRPGQNVSQVRLAKKMGCSTMPVVEAMRRLESEGLLVKESRKMARVRELSSADVEGLYLLREGLEAATSRLCAQRITDEQADRLEELAQTYEATWETKNKDGVPEDAIQQYETAIHRHIAQCACCSLLSSELDRLMLLEQTAGRLPPGGPQQLGHPHVHRAVVRAIVDRDADSAEYLMRKHIQHGYQETLRAMEALKAK